MDRENQFLDELSRLNNELANMQRDLAKRNRVLNDQRSWLWDLLASLEDAVIAVDPDGVVTFMNSAAVRLTGRESGAEEARSIENLVRLDRGEAGADAAPALNDAWRAGVARSFASAVLLRPTGEKVPVSGAATPLRTDDAKPGGAVILLRDMTSARRLQELVIESERMETARLIAAGTAHTVNNILMAILTNAALLARDLPAPQGKIIEKIRDSVRRAAELTTSMLSVSDNRLDTSEIVDLNAVVRTALESPDVETRKRSIELNLAVEGARVKGDPVQLGMVVANILLNAVEATDAAGSIVVATSVEPALPGDIGQGRRAQMTVADTGVGMDDAVLKRLFTPFLSTKFLGRGLGLASARGIVRAHGGDIDVKSEKGKGTTVRVSIPLAESP